MIHLRVPWRWLTRRFKLHAGNWLLLPREPDSDEIEVPPRSIPEWDRYAKDKIWWCLPYKHKSWWIWRTACDRYLVAYEDKFIPCFREFVKDKTLLGEVFMHRDATGRPVGYKSLEEAMQTVLDYHRKKTGQKVQSHNAKDIIARTKKMQIF